MKNLALINLFGEKAFAPLLLFFFFTVECIFMLILLFCRNKMPEVEENAFAVEKTPAYFSYPPYDIPFQIKKHLPKVKLLLIVCDPTKRALSHYKEQVGCKYCVCTFLKEEKNSISLKRLKFSSFNQNILFLNLTFSAAFW